MLNILEPLQNFTDAHKAGLLDEYPVIVDVRVISGWAVAYLVGCFLGPRLMASRKPMDLKLAIQAYNVMMILTNAYVIHELLANSMGKNWVCQLGDFRKTPEVMRHARGIYVYYVSKIVEFADTGFFIARKKNNHVSFLHVYHHASMSFFMWGICAFCPTGDSFVSILPNAIVHVVMYTYYFLATLGPAWEPWLWWKKHLTKLQILQFAFVIQHSLFALRDNCNPTFAPLHYFIIGYMTSFTLLFLHFYVSRYFFPSERQGDDRKTSKANKIE